MDISNLLNTDFGNLNDSNLIFLDDCLSMYDTLYIFLKSIFPICKKTNHVSWYKQNIFSKPNISLVQLEEGFRVSSVKHTQIGDPRHQAMIVNWFETI